MNQLKRHSLTRAAMLLLMMLFTATTAWAEGIDYIDENGVAKNTATDGIDGNDNPTVLTGSESSLGSDGATTWYVVNSTFSHSGQIACNGNVNIILADGYKMTVSNDDNGIIGASSSGKLTIYGQTLGTGTLEATSTGNSAIHLGYNLHVVINGGTVTATGSRYGINGRSITINGGKVTATGDAMGIDADTGTGFIFLGLRTASDFIKASGIRGVVNIKSDQRLTDGTNFYSGDRVDIPRGAAVTLRQANFTDDGDNTYTIHNAAGWNVFCDLLATEDKGYFTGKTVKLGANISVTRMAGSRYHDFTGTFDGNHMTLTINYGTAESPIAEEYAAPFRNVTTTKADPNDAADTPAAIRNLNVNGSIYTSAKYAAGIVANQYGTVNISNCSVSAKIHSSVSGDGTHGGLVAIQHDALTVEGCLFEGRLLTTNGTTDCGGLVGYHSNGTCTISNCLYKPVSFSTSESYINSGATFCRNWTMPADANCYYTATLGTAQGKARHTVTAGEGVTVSNIALTGSSEYYDVSGIRAYDNGGIKYNNTLYYGSGDQVSLTLSNNAPAPGQGYQYGYTASAGTLSGTLLTMPDEDVTVNVALVPIDWATVNQGTQGDPYMIYNKDQLLLLAYRVNGTHGETANEFSGKYFKLGKDIEFTYDPNEDINNYEENYEAIGGYIDGYYRYFKGEFDGADFTVSGIRIRKTGSGQAYKFQGLFGFIREADVHDVHVTDARIKGYDCVGGIVGSKLLSTVSGCTVTETYITTTSGYSSYGTICGESTSGTLTNNYYRHCTVNSTAVTSGKGCKGADVTANDGAMPMYVAYIDADGNQQRCIDYTELTSGAAQTLAAGWYVARGTDPINYTGTLTLGGDVNLILADDAQVNIGTSSEPISSGRCIQGSGTKSLTIYGQTNQSGTLNAYNSSYAVNVKNYTQHGGTVTIDSGNMDALYLNGGNLTLTRGSLTANANINGAGIYGNATVSGGILNAINGYYAIEGALTMSGGTVTANATNYGIYGDATVSGGTLTATATFTAIGDDLALSGTATVKVTGSIYDDVTIAAGQVFTDAGGHYYTGTLTADEKTAINGQTLTRLTALILADDADNATAITKCNGITFPVTLQGRTLYKDGDWNTLTLPFAVSDFAGTPLAGATVMELDNEGTYDTDKQTGLDGTTLNLYFKEATSITAGKPYIVKWDTADDLVNPVFTGVTIDNTNRDVPFTGGSFKGTYEWQQYTQEVKSILFVGTGNNLYWPRSGATLGACRAYFQLTDPNATAREINLSFGDESETTIISPAEIKEITEKADAWYTIDGVRLNGQPTTKGLYIHNGRKVVIK